MELLDNIRMLIDKKIETDPMHQHEYFLIKELLKQDDCFFTLKRDTIYSILKDLDFSNEEIESIYQKMTSPEAFLKVKTFSIRDL